MGKCGDNKSYVVYVKWGNHDDEYDDDDVYVKWGNDDDEYDVYVKWGNHDDEYDDDAVIC